MKKKTNYPCHGFSQSTCHQRQYDAIAQILSFEGEKNCCLKKNRSIIAKPSVKCFKIVRALIYIEWNYIRNEKKKKSYKP